MVGGVGLEVGGGRGPLTERLPVWVFCLGGKTHDETGRLSLTRGVAEEFFLLVQGKELRKDGFKGPVFWG